MQCTTKIVGFNLQTNLGDNFKQQGQVWAKTEAKLWRIKYIQLRIFSNRLNQIRNQIRNQIPPHHQQSQSCGEKRFPKSSNQRE